MKIMKKQILVCILILFLIIGGCSKHETGSNNNNDITTNLNKTIQNKSDHTNSNSQILTKVVDTAQDKCYDSQDQINCPSEGSFFGQDAQYLGNSPSYKDNSDGTITDLNTGLMWIKNAGKKQDYYEAKKTISFAGYNDWRIPSIKELYSLMDFRGTDPDSQGTDTTGLKPFINTQYFDFSYGNISNGDRIIDSQWITTNIYVSKVMDNQECFFGVNFADGRIKCYPTVSRKNNGYYLRYVRGNEYGKNNFIDNNDKTITDKSSGLMWQKSDSGYGMNWESALAYCENLNLAGYTDWRLPNIKELEYIVDYSRSPDTTSSPAIDPIFETTSITNEAGNKDYPYFWSSTTHLSHVDAKSGAYISFGRALGKMNGKWIDVHGAGAQRSDPKIGSASDYPDGFGPQGDARRVDNYVRCVRNGASLIDVYSKEIKFTQPSDENINNENSNTLKTPPQEAIDECQAEGTSCFFQTPQGTLSGTCKNINGIVACVP